MVTTNPPDIRLVSTLARSTAELLRGDFKQSEYGKVILPLVSLRRFDCILRLSQTPDTISLLSGAS